MKLLSLMIGMTGLAASALAAGGPTGSGLVVLDTGSSGALSMVGNARIQIPARAVYVNSSHDQAVKTTGTAVLDAPYLYVVGGAQFGGSSMCTGDVVCSGSPYQDPFSGLAMPSGAGMTDHGARAISGGTVALQPGYYSGGVSITGNASVRMDPGTYVIGGDGFRLTSGSLSGDGVTLVIAHGSLSIAGSSSIMLTPPGSGSLEGMVLVQPSSNTSAMSLAGGSNFTIRGSIYTPGAQLTMVGNSALQGDGPLMGDLVVTKRVELRGTSLIKIGTLEQAAICLPKMPLYD